MIQNILIAVAGLGKCEQMLKMLMEIPAIQGANVTILHVVTPQVTAAHGGNVEGFWDVRRTLAIGDKATGTHVLTELYDEMRAAPVSPDLAQLWRSLGVKLSRDSVEFDDTAPLASIRKAITASRDN